MIKSRFTFLSIVFLSLFFSTAVSAANLGDVAVNLMDTFAGAARLVQIVCILVGTGLITSALIRLKAHRDNPAEVHLSSIIFLLIVGLVLIAISFVPMPK